MYIPYMEAHSDNEELFDAVYFMYVVYKQKHETSWSYKRELRSILLYWWP